MDIPGYRHPRSPIGQTGLPFAQFHGMQLPEPLFDPSYPSALFVSGQRVFVSTAGLRKFIEKRINEMLEVDPNSSEDFKFSMDAWEAGKFKCTACLQVIHREHRRYETDPPVVSDTPTMAHCVDTGKMRTLQDIVENDVLDLNVEYLKRTMTDTSLPIFFVRYRDLTTGHGDVWNKNSEDKNGRALALKNSIYWANKAGNYLWIRQTNDYDKNLYPFISRDSRNDAAMIDTSYFLKEYIEEYTHEARMLHIATKWPSFSKQFFEVYNHETKKDRKTVGVKNIDIEGVVGYDVKLTEGLYCHETNGMRSVPDDVGTTICGEGNIANVVGPNLVKCRPCSAARENICTGPIACSAPPWLNIIRQRQKLDVVLSTTNMNVETQALQEQLYASLKTHIGTGKKITLDVSMDVMLNVVKDMIVAWNSNLTANDNGNGVSGFLTIPYVTDASTLFEAAFNEYPLDWEDFKEYNPVSSKRYEETTGLKGKDGKIIPSACVDAVETNHVDYTQCSQHQGMVHLNKTFIENFTRERGVLVGKGFRGTWSVSRDQMTHDGAIPFWAHSKRPTRDRFATWLLDYTQHCLTADRWNSVCMLSAVDEKYIHLFNPWLGGDYSPIDKCDSTYQDANRAYIIDTLCPKEICSDADDDVDSIFGMSQFVAPTSNRQQSCVFRNGQPSVSRVVGASDPTNLCSKSPRGGDKCTHKQGTLAGPGSKAPSLYTYAEDALARLTYSSLS
jgi:hypothetical protein